MKIFVKNTINNSLKLWGIVTIYALLYPIYYWMSIPNILMLCINLHANKKNFSLKENPRL